MTQPLIWIITSGRRGDIVQCEAIAHHLSDKIEIKQVNPRAHWAWMMPHGPIDPAEKQKIAPPLPDIIIAASRRAVPYARLVHKKSEGKCNILFMKYPGIDVSPFAWSWMPNHDNKAGEKIITTLTAPHTITPQELQRRRDEPDPRIHPFKGPKLGLILGGNTKKVTYTKPAIEAFCAPLRQAFAFQSIMATGSRRTPPALLTEVKNAHPCKQAFVWDGTGPNPYIDILAHSDALLVTGDSHNLVSEALATGKRTYVFDPPGNPDKFKKTLAALEDRKMIHLNPTSMEPGETEPYDVTPQIVAKIRAAFGL